jgi:putative cell wall-binding protein
VLSALTVLAVLGGPTGPGPAAAQAPLVVVRHAGASRTATAAAVADHAHPDGAATAILARADAYGDALAAAPLAAALQAPVLLTGPVSLDPAAADALARLGVTDVVAVGALDDLVLTALADRGLAVRRVRGEDAWGTYAAVAREVVALTGATSGIVVEGVNPDPARGWPDALTASAWAAATGQPILLTSADALPDATAAVLDDLQVATIVGGTAAVGAAVAARIHELTGVAPGRVAGEDRYATAVAVAQRMPGGTDPAAVWLASGRAWPDALVAGPAVAAGGGVLLLSDPATMAASPATLTHLAALRPGAPVVHLVGGTAALADAIAHTAATGDLPAGPAPDDDHVVPGADQRPPPVPARNSAPPISAAVPWSDPATWGGRLPQAGEVVTIPADRAVLLDVDPPALAGLRIQGTLVAADRDLTLRAGWILVTGHLALGTEGQPLTRRVTVELDPAVPGHQATGAGDGALAVQGGTLDLHGTTPVETWTRLATSATAGSSTLQLQQAPGWQVGERIVIASTTTDVDQAEERTVAAVDGARVTLDQPLAHTHWGQTDRVGGVDVAMHAEVASLSRNLRITSTPAAIAARRGGHVMAFEGSVARISGTELVGLGQQGEVARYPVHFHLAGNVSGSYVRGAAIHHTFNRCLTIHGSHYVDVAETVGYESTGHCFFFEDGVETGSTLHCNLGLSTRAPAEGLAILESDLTPATYWITNPTNHLSRNVAAGSDAHGFWFDLPEAPTGLSAGTELDIRHLPLGTFDDNLAHTGAGGWKDDVGIFVEDHHPPTTSVMRRNSAYGFKGFGAWVEGAELHGGVLAGNGIGFLGQRAALVDAAVVGDTPSGVGAELWRQTGVGFYHDRGDVRGVTFAAFGAARHSWQLPRFAMEVISDEHNVVSEVSGVRFVDAQRLRVVQPADEEGPDLRAHAIRDVDGSVSGAPALLASAHPLLHDAACSWREDLRANACPVAYDRVWLRILDLGGVPLSGVTLTREDGVAAPLDGPRWADEASGDILLDRAYSVAAPAAHTGHLELILYGQVAGHVDLAIPWPFPAAHVYDGWGRWHEVAAGDPATGGWRLADGVLHVRHALRDLADRGTWQRMELCALPYCGNAGPG